MWQTLGNGILIVHLSFIMFVLFGGFLAKRWRWLPWLHLPAAAWGIAIELGHWTCPLTPLENWLRQQGGEAGYTGGFLDYYLRQLIYPAGLTPKIQIFLALGVFLLNGIAYRMWWTDRSRNK